MKLFLVSLAVFAFAVAAMSIGVILSNRRIHGSCGGLANLHDEQGRPLCDGCASRSGDEPEDCETEADSAQTERTHAQS